MVRLVQYRNCGPSGSAKLTPDLTARTCRKKPFSWSVTKQSWPAPSAS